MKLSKATAEFLSDLRLSKAPQTVTAYESDLNRLIALAIPDSVFKFTPELVRLYFQSASAQGLKMSTPASKDGGAERVLQVGPEASSVG